jgi:hypothetical protein
MAITLHDILNCVPEDIAPKSLNGVVARDKSNKSAYLVVFADLETCKIGIYNLTNPLKFPKELNFHQFGKLKSLRYCSNKQLTSEERRNLYLYLNRACDESA